MLTCLALACKRRDVVVGYHDESASHLKKHENGLMAVTGVELRPKIRFAPDAGPDAEQLANLHEKAHKYCFIANSVRTKVTIAS